MSEFVPIARGGRSVIGGAIALNAQQVTTRRPWVEHRQVDAVARASYLVVAFVSRDADTDAVRGVPLSAQK